MRMHGNAALSLNGRRRMVLRVVEQGWPLAKAAAAAEVSGRTCSKWVGRYLGEGELGLVDRSSAPRLVANRTEEHTIQAIAALRRLRFTGPEIAELFEMPVSTVSGILTRIGLGRLGRLGLEPAQRYERARPGELIHIDVKKLGRIHGGAGKRITGIKRNARPRKRDAAGVDRQIIGWDYVHIAIDDATRMAYAEVLADERAITAVAFLGRALAFFQRHGITVERVITDNGRPTARRSTRSPAAPSGCATCAPGPTAHRPTARPSASSAPCWEAGPTARSTAPTQNASEPLTDGSGTTTIAGDTAPSATSRPSHG